MSDARFHQAVLSTDFKFHASGAKSTTAYTVCHTCIGKTKKKSFIFFPTWRFIDMF